MLPDNLKKARQSIEDRRRGTNGHNPAYGYCLTKIMALEANRQNRVLEIVDYVIENEKLDREMAFIVAYKREEAEHEKAQALNGQTDDRPDLYWVHN